MSTRRGMSEKSHTYIYSFNDTVPTDRPRRGSKRPLLSEEGLREIAESLYVPVELNMTLEKETVSQEEKTAQVTHDKHVAEKLSSLMAVERSLREQLIQTDAALDEAIKVILNHRIEKIQEK